MPNTAPCFYGKNWVGSRWIRYSWWAAELPIRLPGTYIIIGDGEVVYIGQGRLVASRISAHALGRALTCRISTPWGSFSDIVIKVRYTTKFGDWAMRELRLIERLKPRGNCVGSIRRRSKQ